jgi:hypothetical protein
MNITITVPEGSSNHGDPNLLCTPTKWYEILLFYALNYVSHAVTVKTLPGERISDLILDIWAALIYPYSGVNRGIEAIVRHAAFGSKDDLHVAARAGALCVVVRSKKWRPKDGQLIDHVEFLKTTSRHKAFVARVNSIQAGTQDHESVAPPNRKPG